MAYRLKEDSVLRKTREYHIVEQMERRREMSEGIAGDQTVKTPKNKSGASVYAEPGGKGGGVSLRTIMANIKAKIVFPTGVTADSTGPGYLLGKSGKINKDRGRR